MLAYAHQIDEFIVQIAAALGHDINDNKADAFVQVRRALGGKRAPGIGAVLIARAYQLDGSNQRRAAVEVHDVQLDAVGKHRGELQPRRRRRPSRRWRDRRPGAGRVAGGFLFKGADIHLDAATDMNVHFSHVVFGQQAQVEHVGQGHGPSRVE